MNTKDSNINFSQAYIDKDALALHLHLLGDRQVYCLGGGKYEWDESKSKFKIPKGNYFTEWIEHDEVIDFIEQKNSVGETVWISLNDKEKGNDAITGVNCIYVLWFDIDAPRIDKTKIATEEERNIALKDCKKLKAWIGDKFDAMGFIACSGNGGHLFYPIEPCELMVEKTREAFNDKQNIFLKQISEESGVEIDTTTDIRRLSQAIGSFNLKIPDKPLRSHWIDIATDEDIKTAKKANFCLLKGIQDTTLEQPKAAIIASATHPKIDELLKTDKKLKDLYEGNWQSYDFKSRSEAEASIVSTLGFNGFNDNEIREVMNGCAIGKWSEAGAAYQNLTIQKGREFVETQPKKAKEDTFYLDEKGRRRLNWEIIIEDICREHIFKTLDDTEQVLIYDNGIYCSGITTIKAYLEAALGFQADRRIVSETIGHIQRRTYTPRSVLNADSGYIPVLNGLLNLETLEPEDFDPDKCYTFRLPVEYDPHAGFSHIVEFFKQVLHEEDIETMQEFFGYSLFPALPAHKMLWMLGDGRNGKTTTGNLLRELVSADNVAGVPLNQMDGNHRFSVARLFGKLLNIIAEPETKTPLQTPTLKAAVGGDLLFGEKKGVQETFKFTNFAKFMVYANSVPPIADNSFAFWDRVIVIDFPFTFKGMDAKKDLYKTLIEQDGLGGLLNWALIGLKRLRDNNWEFSETTTQGKAKENMKRRSQPVSTFVEEWTEFGNRAEISKESLFDAFKMYCDVYELIVPYENDFTRDFRRSARVRLTNPRKVKRRVPTWQGIKIKDSFEVLRLYIEGKHVPADKIGEAEDVDIDFTTEKLSDFISGEGGRTGSTYLHLKHMGKIAIIIENEDIFTLYKEKLKTYRPVRPLVPPYQKALCDRCEKVTFLTHSWQNEGDKSWVCDGCASELNEDYKKKNEELIRSTQEQKELGEYDKFSTSDS